jgi:hypothetical protein
LRIEAALERHLRDPRENDSVTTNTGITTRVDPVTASANARRTPVRTGSGKPRIVEGRPRSAAVSGKRSMFS